MKCYASTVRFPSNGRDPHHTHHRHALHAGCAGGAGVVWVRRLEGVTAVMARGKRPAPFRTRKLSLSAPMVLHGGLCGRVGRRRTIVCDEGHPHRG